MYFKPYIAENVLSFFWISALPFYICGICAFFMLRNPAGMKNGIVDMCFGNTKGTSFTEQTMPLMVNEAIDNSPTKGNQAWKS